MKNILWRLENRLNPAALLFFFATGSLALPPASLSAAYSSLPEIPLVYDYGMFARAQGMGGTRVACSEDLSALFFNPAGLALLKRPELSVALTHLTSEISTRSPMGDLLSNAGATRLSSLGVAYPFPTYRGSLVVAAAYGRPKSMDYDYARTLTDSSTWITERGGAGPVALGFAVDISPSVSLGGSFLILTGSSRMDSFNELNYSRSDSLASYETTDDSNISGWSLSLGALARGGKWLRAGITVDFPQRYIFDGKETVTEVYRHVSGDSTATGEITFEDDIVLPFSFSSGVSVSAPYLTLAFDARYTDWREIDYAGPLKAGNFYAYKPALDLRFGQEITVPWIPLKLRAGYSIEPIAYKLLTGNVATITKQRSTVSAGLGVIVEDSVTLDIAYSETASERESGGFIQRDSRRMWFLSFAYRY